MASFQAKLADQLIRSIGEFFTRSPRRGQIRGLLARLGIETAPPVKTIEGLRKIMDGAGGPITKYAEPPVEMTVAGVRCYVWNGTADQTLLYFHGGAYVGGSVKSHAGLANALARETNRRVILVDYRLGPEHQHPAAVEDCAAVYIQQLKNGMAAQDCVMAGDSAGGGLAIAVPLLLLAEGQELPAACACFSPWYDATGSGASYETNHDSDAMLCRADIDWMKSHYIGSATDPQDPLLSPLFAEASQLAKLPRILIQASSSEVLLDDARRFAAKAEQAGTDVTLEIWDDLPHAWHGFAGLVPEANRAIRRTAEWLTEKM